MLEQTGMASSSEQLLSLKDKRRHKCRNSKQQVVRRDRKKD